MGTPKKILVVDDDPVIGRSFELVLSGKDYAVVSADSGEAGLAILAAEGCDLVVADIRMPGISGFGLAERVREQWPRIPVLIITGYASDDSEARAKAAGAIALLHKPLSAGMIETSVAAALGDPQAAGIMLAQRAAARRIRQEEPPEHGFAARVKNIALFFASPFIGLGCVALFPFIGLSALSRTMRARHERPAG